MTTEERYAAIRELYDLLPELNDCKGLCSSDCTDIDMSNVERERIQKRHQIKIRTRSGSEIDKHGVKKCRALDKHGKCRVYEDRPLVCRAWGVIEAAPCPHGCKPDRYLTDEEYKRLEMKVETLGGHWFRSDVDRARLLADLCTPDGKRALKKQMDAARAAVAAGVKHADSDRADLRREPVDDGHSVFSV